MKRHEQQETKKALLIVDLQNDFISGGSLAVHEGEDIIPLVNALLKCPFDVKAASKDWHPEDHGSFAAVQGKKPGEMIQLGGLDQILWPTHCVQGSHGAEFATGWDTQKIEKVFYKGIDKNIDSYSTFFDNGHLRSTGLLDYLKGKRVNDLYFAGLATDYCVKYSVLDAVKQGFKTFVIADACRGVNLKPNDTRDSLEEMRRAGAQIISSQEVLESV